MSRGTLIDEGVFPFTRCLGYISCLALGALIIALCLVRFYQALRRRLIDVVVRFSRSDILEYMFSLPPKSCPVLSNSWESACNCKSATVCRKSRCAVLNKSPSMIL